MGDWIEAGQKAPAFTMKDTSGKTTKLSQFKGKFVVLYFYQKMTHPVAPRSLSISRR